MLYGAFLGNLQSNQQLAALATGMPVDFDDSFKEQVEAALADQGISETSDSRYHEILRLECAKLLIGKYDANPNFQDVTNNETTFTKACASGNLALVKLLLQHGAKPGQADLQRNTPLHAACADGHLSVVELLLSPKYLFQVFKDAANIAGECAIHLAVKHPPVLKALLDNAASVDVQDKAGNTPLHHAVLSGAPEASLQILLDNSADITIVNKAGQTPLALAQVSHYAMQAHHVILLSQAEQSLYSDANKDETTTQVLLMQYGTSLLRDPKQAFPAEMAAEVTSALGKINFTDAVQDQRYADKHADSSQSPGRVSKPGNH